MRTYFLCVYVCNINFDQKTKDKTKGWKNLFYGIFIYSIFTIYFMYTLRISAISLLQRIRMTIFLYVAYCLPYAFFFFLRGFFYDAVVRFIDARIVLNQDLEVDGINLRRYVHLRLYL